MNTLLYCNLLGDDKWLRKSLEQAYVTISSTHSETSSFTGMPLTFPDLLLLLSLLARISPRSPVCVCFNFLRTPPRLTHRTPVRTAHPAAPTHSPQAKFPLPLSPPTPSHPLTVCVYWGCNVSHLPVGLVVFSFLSPPASSATSKTVTELQAQNEWRVRGHSQQEKVDSLCEVRRGWQWVTQVLAVYSSLWDLAGESQDETGLDSILRDTHPSQVCLKMWTSNPDHKNIPKPQTQICTRHVWILT